MDNRAEGPEFRSAAPTTLHTHVISTITIRSRHRMHLRIFDHLLLRLVNTICASSIGRNSANAATRGSVSNHSDLHVLKDRTVPFHSNAEFCDKPLVDVKPPKSLSRTGRGRPHSA